MGGLRYDKYKNSKIMVKVFNPTTFSIKLVSKPKKEIKSTLSGSNISRKCYAVVVIIDGEYKAIVNYEKKNIYLREGGELSNEQLVLPFTEKSLSLKDKTHIWLKHKDKYGKHVCIIRDYITAHLHSGFGTQYSSVRENLLLAGHIVRKDGKMYFEYEDLVAYHYLSEYYLCKVKVDNSKPLFNK